MGSRIANFLFSARCWYPFNFFRLSGTRWAHEIETSARAAIAALVQALVCLPTGPFLFHGGPDAFVIFCSRARLCSSYTFVPRESSVRLKWHTGIEFTEVRVKASTVTHYASGELSPSFFFLAITLSFELTAHG
jgi:hypothetical protein